MNIVLMGMKHCGKSSIGRELGRRLDCPFYDTDDILLENAGPGKTVRQIYLKTGKAGFWKIEKQCFEQLLETLDKTDSKLNVIALGGGMPCNELLSGSLKKLGFFIFIMTDEAEIYRRIAASGIPPFLDAQKPRESFAQLYSERKKCYTLLADMVVELGAGSATESAATILKKLSQEGCLS